MKIIISRIVLFCCLSSLFGLTSCDLFDDKEPQDCVFKRSSCSGADWSFVDPDTYENLMGYDKPINPDSIVILNSRMDTMYHEVNFWVENWGVVYFNPFHELHCFDLCKLDSAFTRTYYLYLGTEDIDTIEAYFAERTARYHLFFNGVSGEVPSDIPEAYGSGRSLFWFQKKIND
ncbi:MAG: hypothetical protein ABJG41_00310 [Cyclobacteriaceae bacterium]